MATYIKSISFDLDGVLPIVFDFGPTRPPAWEEATTKAEFTISGPHSNQKSPKLHRLFVDVFVVLTSEISNNNYPHTDRAGDIAAALDKCFLVMDYGDTGLIEVGELARRKGEGEDVFVTHLRPSQDDTQLHSTILARYVGQFKKV